jgi:hypothetical protein
MDASDSRRLLRALFIRKILDERFCLSALQKWKDDDPQWWNSSTNDMGRGFYGEATRERERLEGVTEGELIAELAAVGAWKVGARP